MSDNPNPMPLSECPTCGYKMNAATCAKTGENDPRPGDFSVCMKCGELFVFQEDLTLQVPKLDQLVGLSVEQYKEIDRTQKMIRKLRLVK